MTNDLSHWRANLAGENPPIHEGDPQPGYYRMRDGKNGPWLPVAIWEHEERGLVARVGDQMRDPMEIWTWVAGNPVAKEDAKFAFANGRWPDEPAGIGHNAPPEETLTDEIARVAEQAEEWIEKAKKIEDEKTANMAGNYISALRDLRKKAEAERKREKQPHLDAARAVDALWKPVIDRADGAISRLRRALTDWMRRKDAEERQKAREAQKKLDEAALPGEIPPEVVPKKVAVGGARGKKITMRERTVFEVVDYDKALDALKDEPEIKAAVQKLAARKMRSGEKVPGVEARKIKEAV